MPDKLKVSVRFPRTVVGSEEYSLVVEVSNLTDKLLTDIDVDRQLLPGSPLSLRDVPNATELDELDDQKRRLVQELEAHIAKAYQNQRLRKMSTFEKALFMYAKFANAGSIC